MLIYGFVLFGDSQIVNIKKIDTFVDVELSEFIKINII